MKTYPLIVGLTAALLSACAAQYPQPPAGQPFATLHIKTNHTASATANVFYACPDTACIGYDQPQLAVFNWANAREKTIRLTPGKYIRIKAIASNALAGVESMGPVERITGTECTNIVSFTPSVDGSYEIEQLLGTSSCRIELVDTKSGKPPTSLAK